MKKFLLNVGLFITLLTLINAYVYNLVEKTYYNDDDYNKIDLSYNNFILSDSHGVPIRDNTENDNIYNFSYVTESYYDMRRKLSYIIENTKVETVFITVNDHSISKYRDISNNLDKSISFADISDYSSYWSYFKEKFMMRYITLFNPKVRSLVKVHISNLLQKNGNDKEINQNKNNKEWSEYSHDKKWDRVENRFETQFPVYEPSIRLINELIKIINISKQNSIRLIGIKYPLSNEYIELLDNKDIDFSAAQILQESGFEVYDFTNYYAKKQHYFANEDHLNELGGVALAKEFVRILNGNFER